MYDTQWTVRENLADVEVSMECFYKLLVGKKV